MARTHQLTGWRTGGLPRGLGVAVLVSMAVHLGALAVSALGWLGASPSNVSTVLDRPVLLRVVVSDPAPVRHLDAPVNEVAARPSTGAAGFVPPLDPRPFQAEVSGPGPVLAALAETVREPALSTTAPSIPVQRIEPEAGAAPLPDVPMVDGYVLRKALSTPPAPREEVSLSWPAGWFKDSRQVGLYSVFIDEHGRVQRMVIDGPTLAPALDEAAQRAFMAARFEPGRVAGKAVKSLIRIEVQFTEDTPVAGSPVVVSHKPL